ncbi:unnamed protein product [Lampetra planeri]
MSWAWRRPFDAVEEGVEEGLEEGVEEGLEEGVEEGVEGADIAPHLPSEGGQPVADLTWLETAEEDESEDENAD